MRLLLSLAVLLTAAAPLSAQCLQPDNVAGPCCAFIPGPNLPAFPAQTLPGESICWDACVPSFQLCSQVQLGAPVPLVCNEFSVNLSTTDCSGNPELVGSLHLDYMRTWDEFPVPGTVTQVWRFIVKADLSRATGAGTGCALPSCMPTHPTAFYYGYLDYAFDCTNGTWESALVLYHGCDAYQHDPAYSSRPGVFHPTRSYALVAPTTSANPFVPVTLPAGGGPVFFQGMRDAVEPSILACGTEEQLLTGNIVPLGSACVCPFNPFPTQATARHMDGAGVCGSDFRSLNFFPLLPWFEVISQSLGAWTSGANYPGPEEVWVDEGLFLHTDVCTLSGAVEIYAEVKLGATTERGYFAGIGPVAADKFTDLVNNYSVDISNPILPPYFGHVMPTRHLVSANYF